MTYDGLDERELERLLGVPLVRLHDRLPSVLDLAHELGAAGAPAGTVVLADEQTAGRGRQGRAWHSPGGAGVWVAVLLRPTQPPKGGALAVRAGLAAVEALAAVAPALGPRLKWPNDLMVAGRKAGGILCEARWVGAQLGWIAVGIGINVRGPAPSEVRDRAVALSDVAPEVTRLAVIAALVPRVTALGELPGELGERERAHFGVVAWTEAEPGVTGVDADGALLVRTAAGSLDRRVVPS